MDKVSWFELPADDVARADTFYSTVFGWKGGPMGDSPSRSLITAPTDKDDFTPNEPGAINGDISPRSQGFDKPLIVISVQDMDAKIKLVQDNGGALVLPRQDIPEESMAWAIVSDTEGNNVAITQDI